MRNIFTFLLTLIVSASSFAQQDYYGPTEVYPNCEYRYDFLFHNENCTRTVDVDLHGGGSELDSLKIYNDVRSERIVAYVKWSTEGAKTFIFNRQEGCDPDPQSVNMVGIPLDITMKISSANFTLSAPNILELETGLICKGSDSPITIAAYYPSSDNKGDLQSLIDRRVIDFNIEYSDNKIDWISATGGYERGQFLDSKYIVKANLSKLPDNFTGDTFYYRVKSKVSDACDSSQYMATSSIKSEAIFPQPPFTSSNI
ncbi:MAG: hypothetical protein ABFR62_13585, partial [Bacteroidota bacterium]